MPWMIARLKRETKQHYAAAASDRMQLFAAATPETYARCLARIWGFEAPVEAGLARTPGLGDIAPLRDRTHIRLLRADLAALGVSSPSELPCSRIVPVFQLADALGWMYVIEQNAQVHRDLQRKLSHRLPGQLAVAGSYLASEDRAVGPRLAELGSMFDRIAQSPEAATRIVEAAKVAFLRQRQWFSQGIVVARSPDDRRSYVPSF